MPRYMANYDLQTSDDDDRSGDYDAIKSVLIEMGAVEVLISQWVLTSKSKSAKKLSAKLRRKFSHAFRKGDRLLVCLIDLSSRKTWFGTSLIPHDVD